MQRCVEGADGPKLLEKLTPVDRTSALALASIGRLLNDPLVSRLVKRRVTAEITAEEQDDRSETSALASSEEAQKTDTEDVTGNLGVKRPRSPATGTLLAWERATMQLREVLEAAQPDFSTVLSDRQQQAVLDDAEQVAKELFENSDSSKCSSRGNTASSRRTTAKRSTAIVSNYFP